MNERLALATALVLAALLAAKASAQILYERNEQVGLWNPAKTGQSGVAYLEDAWGAGKRYEIGSSGNPDVILPAPNYNDKGGPYSAMNTVWSGGQYADFDVVATYTSNPSASGSYEFLYDHHLYAYNTSWDNLLYGSRESARPKGSFSVSLSGLYARFYEYKFNHDVNLPSANHYEIGGILWNSITVTIYGSKTVVRGVIWGRLGAGGDEGGGGSGPSISLQPGFFVGTDGARLAVLTRGAIRSYHPENFLPWWNVTHSGPTHTIGGASSNYRINVSLTAFDTEAYKLVGGVFSKDAITAFAVYGQGQRSLESSPLNGTFYVFVEYSVAYGGYKIQYQQGDNWIDIPLTSAGAYQDPGWGYRGFTYGGPVTLTNQKLRILVWGTNNAASVNVRVGVGVKANYTFDHWELQTSSGAKVREYAGSVVEDSITSKGSYRLVGYLKPGAHSALQLRIVKVDARGVELGLANDTAIRVRVDGTVLDVNGSATIGLSEGQHTIEIATPVYYGQKLNVYWRRYAFWKWSDGSTENPRTLQVSGVTPLTAYVYDERLLLVMYDPHYGSDPWGVKALQLPDRYASYVGQKLAYNASFWMRIGESFTLQAVEGGAARFLRWDIATECYPRNPYSFNSTINLTIGSYGLAVRAVFTLALTNQTLFLPGEGVPNPMFWSIYEQYAMGGYDGRKGTWLLNVTALTTQAQNAFNLDNRTWIYALLVNPSSILENAWVPVNGSWKLYMDKDWDAVAHKLDDCSLDNPYADACRYVAYDTSSISDFPQVVSGTPSKYRGWRLIGLAAWKPLLPNESYSSGAINAVWLDDNSTTYALYNVTFKHVDSGWVYWQPVAVSVLKIESATAKYKLSSYDSQLRRSPIYMWIEAVVNWTYVPPNVTLPTLPPNVTLWMAGFKPHRIGNVGVALENSAGVVVWAPRGSAYGTTGKLYTLSIGDTELFYREPKGLNFGKRDFKLVARFVARAGQPGVRVDDGIPVKAEVSFTLAPATAVIVELENNDPSRLVVDWDCFSSGSLPFSQARMNVNYPADLYYEWGPVDPYNGTLPPLDRRALTGNPPRPIPPVDPDYWVAFYPIPSGNQCTVGQGITVPVPLPAKYPPRAKGG